MFWFIIWANGFIFSVTGSVVWKIDFTGGFWWYGFIFIELGTWAFKLNVKNFVFVSIVFFTDFIILLFYYYILYHYLYTLFIMTIVLNITFISISFISHSFNTRYWSSLIVLYWWLRYFTTFEFVIYKILNVFLIKYLLQFGFIVHFWSACCCVQAIWYRSLSGYFSCLTFSIIFYFLRLLPCNNLNAF